MRTFVILISTLASLTFFPKPSVGEITVKETWHTEVRDVLREATVLCIDDMKFVFAFGNGTGTAISMVQVYEERDGKVVPARCSGLVSSIPPDRSPPTQRIR